MYKKRQLATKTEIRIHMAASYFAFVSRDPYEIAKAIGVTPNPVKQWAKTERWHDALDLVGYKGDRTLITKRPGRKSSKARERAYMAYQMLPEGLTPAEKRKRLRDATGESGNTVYNWVRQFESEKEGKPC